MDLFQWYRFYLNRESVTCCVDQFLQGIHALYLTLPGDLNPLLRGMSFSPVRIGLYFMKTKGVNLGWMELMTGYGWSELMLWATEAGVGPGPAGVSWALPTNLPGPGSNQRCTRSVKKSLTPIIPT